MSEPVYNTWLRIEHLDAEKMAFENGDVWGFALVPPTGWKEGQMALAEPPSDKIKTSVIRNQNKQLASVRMSFMGNVLMKKSDQPETLRSLEADIRLDRELKVIKKYLGDIIRVEGGTKWQIDRTGEKGRHMNLDEGDSVLMAKSAFPSKRVVKMLIVNKGNYELGAAFISEE